MSDPAESKTLWNEGKTSEKEYWKSIFETYPIDSEAENNRLVPQEVVDAYGDVVRDETPLQLLDVGSGPISKLGSNWPDRKVVLTCVDPLAEYYRGLLDTYCPKLTMRPVVGIGETLTEQFGEDTFDLVYSLNALDHAYDPMTAIKNMSTLIKETGLVYFVVVENEAEFWNYEGMHQWNFWIENERLILRDRTSEPVDCATELGAERYRLTCENRPQPVFENTPHEQLRNFIHVTIRKVPSDD